MEKSEILAFCTQVVEKSKFAYLTTINGLGEPETRAMLNLYNRERYSALQNILPFPPFEIFFTTNTSSEKMIQIEKNNKSCVYFVIESAWHGIMLNGDIEIVTDENKKKEIWQDAWVMYYPGTDGFQNPDYSILKLTAKSMKGWNGLEKLRYDFRK
ncbi:MAG: pyridoxamine 5'-phosphate oxidase family protein [Anaerolineaceae bacterium]